MFKLIVIAYVLGTMVPETVQEFEMKKTFISMNDCKKELLQQTTSGEYDVITDFITKTGYRYDWLAAVCYDAETDEEYRIFPKYAPGKEPRGLDKIDIGQGIKI